MDDILDRKVIDSIKAVSADDGFAVELYKIFVDQSAAVIAEMHLAANRHDLLAAKRLAHRLKGSAANVGATALSQKASVIESALLGSRMEEFPLGQVTVDLEDLFCKTRNELTSLALLA